MACATHEFQCGRLRMGLVCRELLPPPARTAPVLGKRLWLLQTRGGRWSLPARTAPSPRLLTVASGHPLPGVREVAQDSPRSGWASPSLPFMP